MSTTRSIARAFTLMELMVAVSILVMIILGVGVMFQGASRSVGDSQALMDTLSNVRAVQNSVDRYVTNINKQGFLVIRSRLADTANVNGDRCDQVAFLAYGTFPNPTGTTQASSMFSDASTATVAHVWIGQLVQEKANPPTGSTYITPAQGTAVPLTSPPAGWSAANPAVITDRQTMLGIHTTLMFPGPIVTDAVTGDASVVTPGNTSIPAYGTLIYDTAAGTPAQIGIAFDGNVKAHMTSSRFAVVGESPSKLMGEISGATAEGNSITAFNVATPGAEWARLCYRFKTLASPYDSEVTTDRFVNAAFRMYPAAIPGVTSFKVDWTDGTYSAVTNDLNWFGPQGQSNNGSGNTRIEQLNLGGISSGDHYIAVFNPSTAAFWPKALRFSYHIADLNGRLKGGRDFVQVVKLP